MNENEEFTHVQRRLCAVIAKSEWTSSRMRMQKSGEELRESRAKSNRTANQFLQNLLEKRTDSDLIDDNGAVDRYHKFLKYKSVVNDDPNSTLDEFDRRLRALNNNRRNQITKVNNSNLNEKKHLKHDLKPTIDIQNQPKPSRILPLITPIPITSTPNDTANELTTSVFHADESQELSNVQSADISFIDSQANHIESSIEEHQSNSLDKTETFNSSTLSLNHSSSQTLHFPKARRSDGTEVVQSSPLPRTSSNMFLFNQCYFPRSLTSREKIRTNSISKRQLPSLPIVQIVEEQQFQTEKLYDLLDHLDNHSSNDFTDKLELLTLSNVLQQNSVEEMNSIVNEEEEKEEEKENILPNFFYQTSTSSTQEKLFYSISSVHIDDPDNLCLYTMTLCTVQLSASILLPYSILNGRRPLLKCSNQTNFKPIRSKQTNYTYQVTAIESSANDEQFQQNDIILKINDQSVWGLTTHSIIDILKQSHNCSLTIARLCQPFI